MNFLKPSFAKRVIFFLVSDAVLFTLSLYFAYQLRFDFDIPDLYFDRFWNVLAVLGILKIMLLAWFKIYNVSWRFFGLYDAKRVLKAHLLALVGFGVLFYLFNDFFAPMPRSVILIDFFLSVLFVGILRIAKRMVLERTHQSRTAL